MLEAILILNALWFAMGFNVFSIRHKIFAKLVVPREQRDTPVFEVLAASGRFLGGFNLAFCVLNLLLIFNLEAFDKGIQWAIILFATAVAHGTQFAFNVPIALQNRQGGGVWPVLKGTMLFIFVTDFVMMVLNAVLAVVYLLS
ncbi:MAG: hypothetical protein CL693_18340 [Cellvibrionaceae bacterium]|nr:hypothetical protein [Cellvibrionaceae bacterium]|tara:strand:- start:20865 stop:21293 length:429 start_codon:yes stop_codon:yes gene_type:complete